MYGRLLRLAFFALAGSLCLTGCNKRVILNSGFVSGAGRGSGSGASGTANTSESSSSSSSASSSGFGTNSNYPPYPQYAAPTCSMMPFLSNPSAFQNPGVMVSALLRVNGVATRVSIGVSGGNEGLVTLPYPATTMFTVNPFVRTDFVAVVEGPGGRSVCSMTVNIVLPNLFPACVGAAAAQNPACFGTINPMPSGMGQTLQYRDEDIVRTTVETRGYCSLYRSGQINPEYKWLATATAPILSVYAASDGLVLATFDLKFMQDDPNRALNLAIDMSPLKTAFGDAWRTQKVRFAMCDDVEMDTPLGRMATHKCSDKDSANNYGPRMGLSHKIGTTKWDEMATEYNAGEIPANFQVGLWWKKNAIPDNDPKCKARQSPLVMNFGGQYPETLSAADGPLFDLIGNGVKKKTSWIAPNAGQAAFLILNPADGKTVKVQHLFGNRTMLPNGQLPAADHENGFVALALYDSNGDGKITSADAVWTKLRLWFDENANGLVDGAYEIRTMADKGVVEIPLQYAPVALSDAKGNSIFQMGVFKMNQPGGGVVDKLLMDYWFYQQ